MLIFSNITIVKTIILFALRNDLDYQHLYETKTMNTKPKLTWPRLKFCTPNPADFSSCYSLSSYNLNIRVKGSIFHHLCTSNFGNGLVNYWSSDLIRIKTWIFISYRSWNHETNIWLETWLVYQAPLINPSKRDLMGLIKSYTIKMKLRFQILWLRFVLASTSHPIWPYDYAI